MLTDEVPLTDHHCHGVLTADLDRSGFEALLSEGAEGTFDTAVGLAVRRWCAPVLDLPPHADPDAYLEKRAELGWRETSSRLLRAAGATRWLLDTGFDPGSLTEPDGFADLAGGRTHEIVRLEAVAETVSASSATELWDGIERAIRDRAADAVGLKTIAAYRCGLDLPIVDTPPDRAAESWLRSGGRLTDPELLGWLVGTGARIGAELGLPLQFHTGFGDADLRLDKADPALLTPFLRATEHTGLAVTLLHCWPFHRNAGYLAHVFRHVSVDVGLAIPYVGRRSTEVLAELFELAPFDSVLFSSDGYGLPELHHLGAVLWRQGMGRLIDIWLADGAVTTEDAERLVTAVAHGNAARLYPLES